MQREKTPSLFLTGAFFFMLVGTAWASIEANAPSMAHELQEASTEIHDYLHHSYPGSLSSSRAHHLEEVVDTIHANLHDWAGGELPESQIASDWEEVKDAWADFKKTILATEYLVHSGDPTLDQMYTDAWNAYKDLRFALRKVRG